MARHRISRGGGWKKSIALAVICVAITLFMGYRIFFAGAVSATELRNFPYTYMSENMMKEKIEKKTGEPIVIVSDSTKKPMTPFWKNNVPGTDPGDLLWRALKCESDQCPYLAQTGKTFLFPQIVPELREWVMSGKKAEDISKLPVQFEPGDGSPPPPPPITLGRMPQPACPACLSAGVPAFRVREFQTPEGQKMLDGLRKRLEAEG